MSGAMLTIGDKVLVTTSGWWLAPDGQQYRAAFGTVRAVCDDEATLGIRTNRNSTNWYVQVGNLTIAGCQIHYVVRTGSCNTGRARDWKLEEGELSEFTRPSMTYDADGEVIPS